MSVGKRDLYAFGAASLAGAVIGGLSALGNWGDSAVYVAGFASIIVIGTLAWHFDWSRVRRLRRRF